MLLNENISKYSDIQKVSILPHPKIRFSEISTKNVTRDIFVVEKDRMICNIMEEIKRNQADIELSETTSEVFPQSSCKKWSFI